MKNTIRVMSIAAVALLVFALMPLSSMAAMNSKDVAAGTKWEVPRTTALSELTVGHGASITAPAGHSLTMTVNGVQRDIKPGTYHGKIVLTVADSIDLKMAQARSPIDYRAAIYVDNGKYIPQKSVAASVTRGEVTDTTAKNILILSRGAKFNGVIVTGNSKYTLDNPVIKLDGNGGNDMAGWGAGVMTSGNAELTLNHATIINRGAIRSALFVCGHSTVHVNNSTIETFNGVLPKNYKQPWDGGHGTNMAVPWMLGLSGNVRDTNVIESGTVYYNNSHFLSEGWGVLSADGPTHVRMYVTNCTIKNLISGYGAFTIGNCIDTFRHDKFDVADIGLIVTGFGSALITDGTTINSRRFGIMMHTNDGKFGTVTINKDSVINSRDTAIEIKGRGVKLVVDKAKINPGNGILIEAIPNDDPYVGGYGTHATVDAMLNGTPGSEKIHGMGMAAAPSAAGAPGGPGKAPGRSGKAPGRSGKAPGRSGKAPGGAAAGPAGPGGGAMPGQGAGNPHDPGGRMSGPVLASFKDVSLLGDIVNARTNQGGMQISLENASLKGAITTAVAEPGTHFKPTKKEYFMMGSFHNIFQQTHEKYGLKVSVDGSSRWTVNQTSYLTGLDIARGARVSAPKGYSLKMTVNGVKKPVQAGSYTGKIVLYVTPAI